MKSLLLLSFAFLCCNIVNSLAQSNIIFEENFENNYLRWLVGESDDYYATIEDGHYTIQYKHPEGIYYFWQSVPIHTDTSYIIESVIEPHLESRNSVYGIIWGVYNANNYNAFMVSNMGKVAVMTCRGGKFDKIVDWTAVGNYQNNQKHKLKIHYTGGRVNFYLDNKKAFDIPPLEFKGGLLGYVVSGKAAAKIDYLRVKQNRQIDLVENAIQGLEKENLGLAINSNYAELHPIIAPDGQSLYFTRQNHPENTGERKKDDGWVSYKQKDGSWSTAQSLGTPINNINHNQIISVSPDNNTLLIGNTYYANGSYKGRGVSITHRQEDGSWEIPKEIIIDNYYNQNPVGSVHLSATKNLLLLSLERNDTKGHLDLYVSFRQANGRFSQPKNLGATINTMYEEGTPFLAADGKTLYFCSAGHGGYGSTDIFVTKRLDDTWRNWSTPKNLGPEINTTGWEGHYSITASGSTAYLVSNNGNKHIGGDDIYKVIPPEAARPEPVLLVKGHVRDAKTNLPLRTQIYYYELESHNEMGTALSEQQKGRYQIVLPADNEYSFLTFNKGYYPVSESIDVGKIEEYTEIHRDIYLHPIEEGEQIPLNNIFPKQSEELAKTSYPELNRLVKFMEKYPKMEIEINSSEMTQANKMKDYLVAQGISEDRISPITCEDHHKTNFKIINLSTADKDLVRVGNFDPAVKVSSLKEGQVFRLDKLFFEADSSRIVSVSANELLSLHQFLAKNKHISIEIGGHTNGLPEHDYCDSLSSARARSAAHFLVGRGLSQERIKYKGYGKRQPIATNETLRGRQRNQRVEIKITKLKPL